MFFNKISSECADKFKPYIGRLGYGIFGRGEVEGMVGLHRQAVLVLEHAEHTLIHQNMLGVGAFLDHYKGIFKILYAR